MDQEKKIAALIENEKILRRTIELNVQIIELLEEKIERYAIKKATDRKSISKNNRLKAV